MVRFDAVIDRLRALPDDRKEAIAVQIDLMLDDDASDPLTPEQWADLEARLDLEAADIPHADVVADFKARFGG
jgi:hypothetical protein